MGLDGAVSQRAPGRVRGVAAAAAAGGVEDARRLGDSVSDVSNRRIRHEAEGISDVARSKLQSRRRGAEGRRRLSAEQRVKEARVRVTSGVGTRRPRGSGDGPRGGHHAAFLARGGRGGGGLLKALRGFVLAGEAVLPGSLGGRSRTAGTRHERSRAREGIQRVERCRGRSDGYRAAHHRLRSSPRARAS